MRLSILLTTLMTMVLAPMAHAQSDRASIFYLGFGVNNDDADVEDSDTPFVGGIITASDSDTLVYGLDFGMEGMMLDSTYGANGYKQAMSFNALVGANLHRTDDFSVDGAALIGVIETAADCPDSFVGYQCYANAEPDVDYDINLGGLVNVRFDVWSVGMRATKTSTQAIVGYKF